MSTPTAQVYVTYFTYPRHPSAGQFLAGPRTPKQVKRNGYGFTKVPEEAWPFSSLKKAAAKARIVEDHMGWGRGMMTAETLEHAKANPVAPDPKYAESGVAA